MHSKECSHLTCYYLLVKDFDILNLNLLEYFYCMLTLVSCHRTNDSSEQSDHTDGDDEAGPAVPVLCGWDEGEQNFPEDGEKVHHVVET